jgi:YD repeat-containing protein
VKHQQGSSPMSFTYNAAGQMVTMLQGTARTTYTYDVNGNQQVDHKVSRTTYTYDKENRLIEQNIAGTRITHGYDGDGLRRYKIEFGVGPVRTTFVWDGTDYLGEY